MAEPARARTGTFPATDPIEITYSQANGYGFDPSESEVAYDGTVEFITNRACWVWTWVGTTPTNVFENQTGYYVACAVGGDNDFTAIVPDITIVALATDPNAPQPPPPSFGDSVKGTISVGSMGAKKKE